MLIETARKTDAGVLASLINQAGEGIPEYLWRDMCERDETPMDVGIRRAAREEGGFSYRNAQVCRIQGEVAGILIGYRQDNPYSLDDIDEYPEIVKPLVMLESKAPGSWYINALATQEKFRRMGIATALLNQAEQDAKHSAVRNLSIIVASENTAAKKLYLSRGYSLEAELPVVTYPGAMHGGKWQLLIKNVNGVAVAT